jgi:hypothetical protein
VEIGQKRCGSAGVGVAGAVKMMLHEHMHVRQRGRNDTAFLSSKNRFAR